MASVTIRHEWDTETSTSVHVEVDSVYPQVLDEARAIAVRAFGEAMATFAVSDDE